MIIFAKEVINYFDDLIFTLFKKEYFVYIEFVEDYVDRIIDFIEQNLEQTSPKNTPLQIHHLGSKYIFYKANQRTTWYIFFEKKEENYLITYITNNHSIEAKCL